MEQTKSSGLFAFQTKVVLPEACASNSGFSQKGPLTLRSAPCESSPKFDLFWRHRDHRDHGDGLPSPTSPTSPTLAVASTASPNQPKQQLKRSEAQAIKKLRLKPDDRLFISHHCARHCHRGDLCCSRLRHGSAH